MKEIPVKPNAVAMVDDELFDFLNKTKWYLSRDGYAIAGDSKCGVKSLTKMHRLVAGAKQGELVDHIDQIKLNNQTHNLRIANRNQNVHNQKKRSNTKSKYKGVSYNTALKAWGARCRINFEDHFLGYYTSEVAAGYAYNKKAKSLSKYALLNNLSDNKQDLEKLLAESRLRQKPARMKSKYRYVFFKVQKKKNGNRYECWAIMIFNDGKRTYKDGFKTDKSAHEYIVENYMHLIGGKSLLRK